MKKVEDKKIINISSYKEKKETEKVHKSNILDILKNNREYMDSYVLCLLSIIGGFLYLFSSNVTILMLPIVLLFISIFSHVFLRKSLLRLIYDYEEDDTDE